MTEKLPKKINEFINKYFELDILGTTVRTPYYRNVKRVRAGLRSLTGKGSSEEIIEETVIYAKLRDFYFTNKSEGEIRKFMESQGIGIDCSGFVSHIINYWLKISVDKGIGSYLHYPDSSFRTKIARKLRVIENIGANLLTSELNCTPVRTQEVKPGDLIRLRGVKRGFHIAMVYKVNHKSDKLPEEITYVHSSENYGEQNGVKFGKIVIKDINKPLSKQEWTERDDSGKNYTLEGYLKEEEDNGFRRLKFSSLLKWK